MTGEEMEERWCDICDRKIHWGGVVNYKTGMEAHVKCARKEGLIED